MVAACCRAARRAGVRAGIPLAEAKALCGVGTDEAALPRFLPEDPPADRKALQRLAWDCATFSPLVGIEDQERPSSLLLDISGCGACFGGEPRLARQLQESLQTRRYYVRIGISDTMGTAWAVAHFQKRSQTIRIVPAGEQEQVLRPLPIEALRLSPPAVEKLHHLDIRQITQLLALPRRSLPSRFGEELLLRLDQALGEVPETIVAERRPVPIREVWESDCPLQEAAALDVVAALLVERALEKLQQRGEGLLELHMLLQGDGESAHRPLSLLRPTSDGRHVMGLLRLWWERFPLPRDITRVEIEVVEAATLPAAQQQLWPDDDDCGPETHGLIEKLSSRLGRRAVLRPQICAEQQPELAFGYESCIESARSAKPSESEPSAYRFLLSRPLWLKREPAPVQVWCIVPDGPPYRFSRRGEEQTVARCWGPERITTGWWRGTHVRRDYYHVETAAGCRYWLFRDWEQGGWFLHALFD